MSIARQVRHWPQGGHEHSRSSLHPLPLVLAFSVRLLENNYSFNVVVVAVVGPDGGRGGGSRGGKVLVTRGGLAVAVVVGIAVSTFNIVVSCRCCCRCD